MGNIAKPRPSIAPKRRKIANDGRGSVVAEFRQNRDGTWCGPYYYFYRYVRGRREKSYLPREEAQRKQRALAEMRAAAKALGDLLRRGPDNDRRADTSRANGAQGGHPTSPTGRYWHGGELRDSRSVSTKERDRALFNYNEDAIREDLGFAISEDDYVELMRRVREELARRSQRGERWEDGLAVEVRLDTLPSWLEDGGLAQADEGSDTE